MRRMFQLAAAGIILLWPAVSGADTPEHPLTYCLAEEYEAIAPEEGDPILIRPEKKEMKPIRPFGGLLRFGMETYFGMSNIGGPNRRSTDGTWAGSGMAYPSFFSLNWEPSGANIAKVSFGIGDMYTGRGSSLRQPVEAFYQFGAGQGRNVTVGKFYSPFALQEWQYETRPGVQFAGESVRGQWSIAVQHSDQFHSTSGYARFGRNFGKRTSAGVSAAAGRGFTYGSSHDLGIGADLSHDLGFASFSTEYMWAGSSARPFQFAFGKLSFSGCGLWTPYVGSYWWHDKAGELGRFSSGLIGVDYQLTQISAIGTGIGRANGRNVFWFESKTAF